MKTAALFLALSLSTTSFGCGTENDGTSPSDDGGMTGKMDDPFADRRTMGYPAGPEGELVMMTMVCKNSVYFYESKDKKSINWFGFWNKNDTIVHTYVYDEKTTDVSKFIVTTALKPNQKGGLSVAVDRGLALRLETEKLDMTGRNLLPCETVHTTMP